MDKSSFMQFKRRLGREVLNHSVISANPYTRWFRHGLATREQAQAFLVQFSVFSNEFLFAQLRKMVNADTLDEMRASKEILANEIGVGYRGRTRDDAELGSLAGTIEGGTFHFGAAHFELLLRMAKPLNLTLAQFGKRRLGTPETLHFCDELMRLCRDRCTNNLVQACLWLTVTDVFSDRPVEEKDVLMNNADMAT